MTTEIKEALYLLSQTHTSNVVQLFGVLKEKFVAKFIGIKKKTLHIFPRNKRKQHIRMGHLK